MRRSRELPGNHAWNMVHSMDGSGRDGQIAREVDTAADDRGRAPRVRGSAPNFCRDDSFWRRRQRCGMIEMGAKQTYSLASGTSVMGSMRYWPLLHFPLLFVCLGGDRPASRQARIARASPPHFGNRYGRRQRAIERSLPDRTQAYHWTVLGPASRSLAKGGQLEVLDVRSHRIGRQCTPGFRLVWHRAASA